MPSNTTIAEKLLTIHESVEGIRDALQEFSEDLGKGTIDTLADDVRTLSAGKGYGVQIYGDVRNSEEVQVIDPETNEEITETRYSYTSSLILDTVLLADGDQLNTDVIDGLGELDGDMVNLPDGKVQIPLNTGTKIVVDPNKVYVKFRDPVVENIILTNWGEDGKITLKQVRNIKNFSRYFFSSSMETFNELKWFDGLTYNPTTGANTTDWQRSPFPNCKSLREVKLPRVASLGTAPFVGCSSLTYLEIPDSFTNLGRGYCYQEGFFKGTAIEEVIMPDSITDIQSECFQSATSVKKIRWSSNLPFPRGSFSYNNNIFGGASNLETIENVPEHWAENDSARCLNGIFNGCSSLVFSPNLINIIQEARTLYSSHRAISGTKIFDYAPNATLTFPDMNIVSSGSTFEYCFENEVSEGGFVLEFPNWTFAPIVRRAGSRIGKVVLSENLVSMSTAFGQGTQAPEWIVPCPTPPAFMNTGSMNIDTVCRFFVPSESVELYKSASGWDALADRIRPYRDPSTAAATFCSIPDEAPVPAEYTKVAYISNISGSAAKNCQISTIGYVPKRYSQILLDFSHKRVASVNYSNYIFYTGRSHHDISISINSTADDRAPCIDRTTSGNANYPNPMGLTRNQRWWFNSKITGEAFGQRSVLKLNYHWIEYHGLAHQVDEVTGDAGADMRLFMYNNNLGMTTRQVKVNRMCAFEPVEGFTDVDDPTQYELVRDWVPVMRNSDGVFGLYERVLGTFRPSTKEPFSGPEYE